MTQQKSYNPPTFFSPFTFRKIITVNFFNFRCERNFKSDEKRPATSRWRLRANPFRACAAVALQNALIFHWSCVLWQEKWKLFFFTQRISQNFNESFWLMPLVWASFSLMLIERSAFGAEATPKPILRNSPEGMKMKKLFPPCHVMKWWKWEKQGSSLSRHRTFFPRVVPCRVM